MVNNPFLKDKNIADNKNTQNKNSINPFIEAKKNADAKQQSKKRKSILFYLEDYEKIDALRKTKGETITGLLNNLVDDSINSLSESDKERYDKFLN